ncbi:MAG: hypothetical protein ACYDH6_06900 [Acidimicrobiales bacterium]
MTAERSGRGGVLALDAWPPPPVSYLAAVAVVPALAAALAVAAIALGLRGVDWAAQLYRIHLFQSYGFLGFDASWYGGQAPLAYSVIFPALAGTIGVPAVVACSAAAAAWAFDRLVRTHLGQAARVGSAVFAAATVVEVVVGQLAFLLGLALALLCVVALVSGRRWWAVTAAVACACTSGVAAGFLVLALVAWAVVVPARRRLCVALATVAVAPVATLSLAYGQGGSFPFRFSGLAFILGLCATAWLLLPAGARVLRVGTALYACASIAAFVVPNPMGGNMGRLGTAIGVPLLVSAAWPRRKAALCVVALPLLGWQWGPGLGAVTSARSDASRQASYFAPLIGEIAGVHQGPARIEIPPTHDHWEATWVAPTVPLARGWERQLDKAYNALFYAPGPLDANAYHAWLDANGVSFVALPDVALDYSATAEGQLLAAPPAWLQPVWSAAHWKLWRVVGSPGLVTGPADLTTLGAGQFTLTASTPGDVLVRVRYSPTWGIDGAGACLTPAPDGWTGIRIDRPGTVQVTAGILPRASSAC